MCGDQMELDIDPRPEQETIMIPRTEKDIDAVLNRLEQIRKEGIKNEL